MANAAQPPHRCCYAYNASTYDMEAKYFSWAEDWIDADILDWQRVRILPKTCQNVADED